MTSDDTVGGVLVIGDVVTDVLALHQKPPAPRTDTAADIEVRAGGSAGNTAAWAAFLGADVTLLARVGTDTGEWHRAQLDQVGVRPRLVVDPDHATAVIIVMVDGTGERTMLTDRGAGGRLGLADWDDALLDGVGHLHVSGYALFTDCGRELARAAMARARSRAITVSLDPASTGFLEDFGVGRFIEATGDATIIFPNREEAALLTGGLGPAEAAIELSAVYDLVVVKLGADGAVAARDGYVTVRAPAVRARMVDSTGAGDAFAGGFIAARVAGGDEAASVLAGTRAGALAINQVGGRPR